MELIIFDYDGVLMDTFAATVKIYLDISKEFHLNLPEHHEFFKELFELDWRETMKKLNIVTKEGLEKQERIFKAGLKKYADMVKPYRGMPEVLRRLSGKCHLAVVTNNLRQEVEMQLKKYDLHKYFSAILTCEDGEMKPHPDLLLKCMARLKVSNRDTVFVGDMDGDIVSGRAANISRIVAVTYGYHLKHRLKEADIILNSPSELIGIV